MPYKDRKRRLDYAKKYNVFWYQKYRIRRLKECLIYRKSNVQKIKQYFKTYRKTHKDKIRDYYKINKEKILRQNKIYYIKNREERLNYYYKNKPRLNHLAAKRKQIRLRIDILFKIKINLRGRIISALRGKSKALSTMLLLGCEIDYLLYHLQSNFKSGMTWKNYGKIWEIDHIKPCCSFDLTKNLEQKKCFYYTNLRPQWIFKNRSDGGKLSHV